MTIQDDAPIEEVEDKMQALRRSVSMSRAAQDEGGSTDDPHDLPSWVAYIQTLSGADLLSKAVAANQVAFVRELEVDGLSPIHIAAVLKAFAVRLLDDGQVLPGRSPGDYVDYGALAYPVSLHAESVPE